MNNIKYEFLVVGLGNILMSDDGLGVHVIEELKQRDWPLGILIVETGTSILNYLSEISRARNIIIIDAIRAGGAPGTIYRFTSIDIVESAGSWTNSHEFSLPGVIQLAREITGFPVNLIIYGVEPLNLSFGNRLSLTVKKTLPRVVKEVVEEIEKYYSKITIY